MIDHTLPLITDWTQVQQLRDAAALTAAETRLLDQTALGENTDISVHLPNLQADHVLIRAPLLRYLVLGGCADFQTRARGIQISGAWISGQLDLSFAQSCGPLSLFHCHMADQAQMVQLRADGLALVGCNLAKGLNASRIQINGNVTLNGTRSGGKIGFSGAEIKGHFSCVRATLRNASGSALKAQGLNVSSSVLLEGTSAEGMISLLGSRIGGQLICTGAELHNPKGHALNVQSSSIRGDVSLRYAATEGEVSFLGAEINGVLDCSHATLRNPDKPALNAQRLVVSEGFIWRKIKRADGAVDLTSAHVGDLWDDPESWAACERLLLGGFVYDVLHGGIDVPDRLAWLKKGAVSRQEFYPQPYEQLAKLLRETGHRSDARGIMVAKEKEQRKATRARWRREIAWRKDVLSASRLQGKARDEAIAQLQDRRPNDPTLARMILLYPTPDQPDFVAPLTLAYAQQDFQREQSRFAKGSLLRNGAHWIADRVFGVVVGYGHKPESSFFMLMALVLIGWLLAAKAWEAGDFAPAAAPVLMSQNWQSLATNGAIANPAEVWSARQMSGADGGMIFTAGRDYESFHALAYAVDIVVPIVALGQDAAWAPSTSRGVWGKVLWKTRWWLNALGWIVTAIGAAAVTGVIRRD